ncbi:ABC transporter family substrate-binding protein [Quadrisphaera granulorum]|nr:ABC transporter family substrate-binding protein [Quadrisphaera granulorum]
MRTPHRRFRAGAVLVAAALALAGCTSSGSQTSEPESSASASAALAKLPAVGWTAAARDKVKDGGTLRLPVDSLPANWNLLQADSGTVDDQLVDSTFLPSFVKFDEKGQWSADPDYATKVELVSQDPQIVEITINPKAVWSDGTPITAADVAANWKALNGVDPAFAPTTTNVWQDVSAVDQGATPQDVKITFAKVNVDWPSILRGLYPAWAYSSPDAFNKAWASGPFAPDGKTYVSGGPFILQTFDANGGTATFTRNPKWWGDAPKLEQLVFKTVSRDAVGQAFANGEIDAFNLNGSADNLKTVESKQGAVVQRSLGPTFRHVTLNGKSEVFSNALVRQAFATALDRKTLAAAILGQVGSPVQTLGNLIFVPGQQGYVDQASNLTGDPAAAKKLLEQAGATFDGDKASLNGKPLNVRFVIPSNNTNSANIATLVQQQTAAAGFTVTIDSVPSADFFVKYVDTENRNFDATYFAWQGTPFPISSTESIYYPADSGQNFPGITDDSLGADWAAANAEFDPAKRIEMANNIDKKLIALYSTIPLFAEPYAWGAVGNLANYGPSLFESTTWQDVGFTS